MATVNVTIGLEPITLEVDEHASELGLSRSEYIRRCIGEHPLTPMDEPDRTLEVEFETSKETAGA